MPTAGRRRRESPTCYIEDVLISRAAAERRDLPPDASFDPIPTDPATVLDPDWLARALDVVADGDRVIAVEQAGSSRTIAEKLRFAVTVEAASGARRTYPLCAKAHFDGINSLITEAHVYRDLHPAISRSGRLGPTTAASTTPRTAG